MYSLKAFICNDPDELYRQALNIHWEKMIQPDGYFSVISNVFHPTIQTNLFANLRVKDAIVDRIRKATNKRPTTGSELSGAVVYLFWKNDEAELFLDTSGASLARHGYRKLPGKAPMLEALAAATILSTKWDRFTPFINPMCGSGTLAIEAALIATKCAPGLLRDHYAFMHLLGYDPTVCEEERSAAGVEDLIDFQVGDFESTKMPDDMNNAIVMFNPEYGERLGEEVELEKTYARMGDFLKNKCKGATGYIFTGNLELAKKIRLKPSRRIEFLNAKIDCRLLEYEMYEGTRRVEKAPLQSE
jgi:putative N6-adenine-specific DNA methylase